ncbi:MAG: carbohydrate ABC transporter permease, partial [bacterium]|nr:carbohydrate ABC transporter permease [bacterium]
MDKISKLFIYLVLIAFAAIMVLPFIWMLSASLRQPQDIYNSGVKLLPVDQATGKISATLNNYREVMTQMPFGRMFLNSLFVAVVATAFNLFFNAMAAYAFARIKFPFKEKIFGVMLASLMIPFYVIMIPLVYITKNLGMYDSLWGLIVPVSMSVYNVFLIRQFIVGIPVELEEAATLDGCSRFRIFWSIIMPLSKPVLAVVGIFTFMFNWNNFTWPLVLIISRNNFTLPLGLGALMTQSGSKYHLLLAGATITIIPMVIIFLILQKYIIKGITMGAVK